MEEGVPPEVRLWQGFHIPLAWGLAYLAGHPPNRLELMKLSAQVRTENWDSSVWLPQTQQHPAFLQQYQQMACQPRSIPGALPGGGACAHPPQHLPRAGLIDRTTAVSNQAWSGSQMIAQQHHQ